jgi:CubicO group peptidase (beta-lactamase class C family)
MMRRLLVMLLGCAASIVCTAVSARAEGPSPALAEWIGTRMREANVPGASVALIRDGAIAWTAGFGVADVAAGTKITPATLFQAASISKPITAIAAMIAVAENELKLDQDINTVFAQDRASRPAGAWRLQNPFPTPVTLRLLLSHTAGTNDFHYSGYRYGYYADPPRPIEPIPSLYDELAGQLPANTPAIEVVREPGRTWAYSPAGYTIVQAALETVGQAPFATLMDEMVLRPFGMVDSTFAQPTPPDVTARMARPYLPDGKPMQDGPLVFDAFASGGLTTTAADLARIVIAMQDALAGRTRGWLTPGIAQAMMVRQPGRVEPGKCFPTAAPPRVACENSWGLGFDVNLDRAFQHVPDGEPTGAYFGHSGFNSGYLAILIGSKAGGHGLVAMVNSAPIDMSGDVPQFSFLTDLVRRVADDEKWP